MPDARAVNKIIQKVKIESKFEKEIKKAKENHIKVFRNV